MGNITPQMIKELRERSGVGMTKCKEALVESDGDMQKAIEFLRKKGLASAIKKEGRDTKEGTIGFSETENEIALLEVNTETDFVAKNEKFQKFVKELSAQAAKSKPASLDAFLKENYDIDPSLTIEEYRNLLIQSIGENIQIARVEIIKKEKNASYGIYSHMGGKILCVVEISGSSDEQKIAKDIAMHVAADSPEYLTPEQIPADIRKKEEEIARSQVQGKPEFVIEKIITGKLKAFEDSVCLVGQKFVKDPSITVQKFVENREKEIDAKLKISCFWRWMIGSSK
ncbi:MAG: Elongation factor Ts [Candidatus Anoxychlamydiales bacterium]|nr:Elongation factor Ts [Candidatus Anoxychlamydiales bacterium]